MIHILYTQDHQARGEALAAATPGSTHGLFNHMTHTPLSLVGLETLIFWGHGDQFGFCGMKSPDAIKVITKWKKQNPKLKAVELITCNARHCTSGDPFANAVKMGLRSGFMNPARDVKVKALPVSVGGKMNAFSILLAEPNFKSWAYITAPGADDKLLMDVDHMITTEPIPTGGVRSYKGDLAMKADKIARENTVRSWTLNYGYLSTLRAHLGKV